MKKLIHLVLAMTLFGGLVATPAIAQSGASGVVAESGASSTYAPPANSKDDFVKWAREMKERKYASRVPGKVLKKRASLVHGKTSSGSAVKTGQQVANQSVLQSRPGSVSVPSVSNTATGMSVKTRVVGAAGKILNVAAVAMGVDLVYDGATQVTGKIFGVESNGLMCDFWYVISGNSDCSTGANAGYVPNQDVYVGEVPGIVGETQWTLTTARGNQVVVSLVSAYEDVNEVYFTFSVSCPAPPYQVNDHIAQGTHHVAAVDDQGRLFRAGTSGGVSLGSVSSVCGSSGGGAPVQKAYSRNEYANLAFLDLPPFRESGPTIPVQGSDPSNRPFLTDALPFYDTVYYFEGTPQREELDQVDENPLRWWQTVGKCEKDGGTRLVREDSVTFRELDETWPDFPEVACDVSGEKLVGYEIWQHTQDVGEELVYTWNIDQETKDWLDTHPECTNGSCTLELERYDTQTRRWLACFDNPELCASWFADPLKTELYRCVYNGEVLDLSDCNLYSKLFDSKQKDMLADPETGLTDSEMTPKPAPETGDNTNPITGNPLIDQNANCPPEFAWSELMNLWWYYQGVKCALVEVFIPKVDRSPFEPALAKFQQGKLGGLIYGFEDQITALEAGAPRCQGPGGNLSLFTGQEIEFYPLNSCSGWQADLAPIVKGFLTFLIGMYTLAAIANILMQSLGFNSRGES